jgi:hypothetical protein
MFRNQEAVVSNCDPKLWCCWLWNLKPFLYQEGAQQRESKLPVWGCELMIINWLLHNPQRLEFGGTTLHHQIEMLQAQTSTESTSYLKK